MWIDSNNTRVMEDTSLPVYQVSTENSAELVVGDLDMFTNGVYQCLNASLGLFIGTPGNVSHTVCAMISYTHFVFSLTSAETNCTVSMLSVSSSTVSNISLTWSVEGSPNETGYFISYQRTDLAGLTPQWVFIEGVATSHTLMGLLGGTNYDITLRLVEGTGVNDAVPTSASTMEGSECVVWINVCMQVMQYVRSRIAFSCYPLVTGHVLSYHLQCVCVCVHVLLWFAPSCI